MFFLFSFHQSSFSTIFFYICFLSSSSSSSSFPILSPLSSYKFFCSLLLFLDFTFSSSLFILFFSLYLLFFLSQFILHFLTLLFLSLCFSFLRGTCNFLHIPYPWWTTNSVHKPSLFLASFISLHSSSLCCTVKSCVIVILSDDLLNLCKFLNISFLY